LLSSVSRLVFTLPQGVIVIACLARRETRGVLGVRDDLGLENWTWTGFMS
jgi:hypothetical protein